MDNTKSLLNQLIGVRLNAFRDLLDLVLHVHISWLGSLTVWGGSGRAKQKDIIVITFLE